MQNQAYMKTATSKAWCILLPSKCKWCHVLYAIGWNYELENQLQQLSKRTDAKVKGRQSPSSILNLAAGDLTFLPLWYAKLGFPQRPALIIGDYSHPSSLEREKLLQTVIGRSRQSWVVRTYFIKESLWALEGVEFPLAKLDLMYNLFLWVIRLHARHPGQSPNSCIIYLL